MSSYKYNTKMLISVCSIYEFGSIIWLPYKLNKNLSWRIYKKQLLSFLSFHHDHHSPNYVMLLINAPLVFIINLNRINYKTYIKILKQCRIFFYIYFYVIFVCNILIFRVVYHVFLLLLGTGN